MEKRLKLSVKEKAMYCKRMVFFAIFVCAIAGIVQLSGNAKAASAPEPVNVSSNIELNLGGNSVAVMDILNLTNQNFIIGGAKKGVSFLAKPSNDTVAKSGGTSYGSVMSFFNTDGTDWEIRIDQGKDKDVRLHLVLEPSIMKYYDGAESISWTKIIDEINWAYNNNKVDPSKKQEVDRVLKDYQHWKDFNPKNTVLRKSLGTLNLKFLLDPGLEPDTVINEADHMVFCLFASANTYVVEVVAMRGNDATMPRLRLTLWMKADYSKMKEANTKTETDLMEIAKLKKMSSSGKNSEGGV